jgi:hypothetical protein
VSEHYKEAVRALGYLDRASAENHVAVLAEAQVYATLAVADAINAALIKLAELVNDD